MSRRKTHHASVTAAVFLSACATSSGVGRGADLDPAKVTAIEVAAVGGEAAFCPGGPPLQLKAIVTAEGGARLETWAAGEPEEGKLGFDRFEWSAAAGQVDAQGRLQPPADSLALVDHTVTVTARVVGKPDIEGKLELSPTWRCGGTADARGPLGHPGAPGMAGEKGRAGRPGGATGEAENGELGSKGQDAAAGGAGGAGPAVDVALAYVTTRKHGKLVLVRIGDRSYLFDPAGEKFHVRAGGGAGGQGGAGGPGGQGGEGGDTNGDKGRAGNGSDGGDGGAGGRGGAGGDGGAIRVQYDGNHQELLQSVVFESAGGPGGPGGAAGEGGRGGAGGNSPTGQRGTNGRTGHRGPSGGAGQPGRDGPAVDSRPGDVRQLFADEIGRGVPIDVGGG